MDYTTRPLSDRAWLRTGPRRNSQFSASWSVTLEQLSRELGYLDARRVVIGMDITESEIRNDGLPRANCKPQTPAVEVAFESKYGPLVYRCDEYRVGTFYESSESWKHNVRAIALTLEALRAVDRYGASARGEQYRGYRALEAGSGGHSHMTHEDAEALVRRFAHVDDQYPLDEAAIRRAKSRVHPDRHDGDQQDWDLLMKALEVVEV